MKIALIYELEKNSAHYGIYEALTGANTSNDFNAPLKKLIAFPIQSPPLPHIVNVIANSSHSSKLGMFTSKKLGVLFQTRKQISGDQLIEYLLAKEEQKLKIMKKESNELRVTIACKAAPHENYHVGADLELVCRQGGQKWIVQKWIEIKPKYIPLIFAFANKHQLQVCVDCWINGYINLSEPLVNRTYSAFGAINETETELDLKSFIKNPSLENLERLAAISKLLTQERKPTE